jgi:hypothetical protein
MNNKNSEAYKLWAPPGKMWSAWAKPVLFADMPGQADISITVPAQSILAEVKSPVAVIIDLPGKFSVEEGLALAAVGYRPVPLYNGVAGSEQSKTAVPVKELSEALAAGAGMLEAMDIQDNAPPVFLLDSSRSGTIPLDTDVYDNRWSVFYDDFPAADQLSNAGIREIVVFTSSRMTDLLEALYKYEEHGLNVFFTDGNPDHVMVLRRRRRSFFRSARRFFTGHDQPYEIKDSPYGYLGACESSYSYTGGYYGYSGSGYKGGYSGGGYKGYSGSGYGGGYGGYGG